MLRSERSERLEAWAADTLLLPTLRDGPAGLLRGEVVSVSAIYESWY